MSNATTIEWTDATWSPWEGCTKVGPGCDHCYAERMNRWLRDGANWGSGAPRLAYSAAHWQKPIRWNREAVATGRRMRVFPSVCDPFDNEVPDELRAQFWSLIEATPALTWLLLTKRIGNVRAMVPPAWLGSWPHNVWLGATVVNQEEVDRDVPKLLALPAYVRFLSCEPLLGPINLGRALWKCCERFEEGGHYMGTTEWLCCGRPVDRDYLHWVIGGGESGPMARPMHPDWARSIRDQCVAAGVPFLFKQWGEWAPGECATDAPTRTERTATWWDGKWDFSNVTPRESEETHRDDEPDLYRFGKKTAGRTLDGRTWDEFPT